MQAVTAAARLAQIWKTFLTYHYRKWLQTRGWKKMWTENKA